MALCAPRGPRPAPVIWLFDGERHRHREHPLFVLVADFDDDDMTCRTERQIACDLTRQARRVALGSLQVLTARIRNEPWSLADVEVEARNREVLTAGGSRSRP